MIDLTQQETIPFNFLLEHSQSLETFSTTSEPLLINIQDRHKYSPANEHTATTTNTTPHYMSTNELSAKSHSH